jgi:hypothetical protein
MADPSLPGLRPDGLPPVKVREPRSLLQPLPDMALTKLLPIQLLGLHRFGMRIHAATLASLSPDVNRPIPTDGTGEASAGPDASPTTGLIIQWFQAPARITSDAADGERLAFEHIALLPDGLRGPRHAHFCEASFARLEAGAPLSLPAASAPGEEMQRQQQTPQQTEIMDKNTAATAARPATPAPKTRVAIFTKEKDTKNTVKFTEVAQEGEAPICGTLYLQRWFVGAANNVQAEITLR